MIYKALASAIMASVLQSTRKEVIEVAKVQAISAHKELVRKELLAEVARKYSEEVEFNVSQYIKALGQSSVELEFKGKPGEALITKAEHAISELEGYLEKQNPDGAVIQYLQRRYKEEGIRIITGRLYGGHYVNKKGQGVFEVVNRMGYAASVDKTKPWLTGLKTQEGLESMITQAALEIFNLVFEDANLSDDLAALKFTGVAKDIQDISPPKGFGKPASAGKKKKR